MMQSTKKTSLIEFLYIALLLAASRPPDLTFGPSPYRSSRHQIQFGHNQNNGPLLVDNYYYDEIRSIHLNGFSHDRHFSTKSSILLLQETLDVLEDINSLGRYSPYQVLPSSNLIAYPVSRGFHDHDNSPPSPPPPPPPSIQASTQNLPSISDDLDLLLDDFFTPDIFENLNDDPLIQADDDFLDRQSNPTNNDQQHPQQNNARCLALDQNGNHEAESPSTMLLPTTETEMLNDYLLDDSVMLPILESSVNGDVNDMFDHLELFLSNETDAYGQEWSTTNSYPTAGTGTTTAAAAADESIGVYPPLFDTVTSASLCNNNNNQNNNLYADGQIVPVNDDVQAPQQYSSQNQNDNNNNNNFGSVLYSSLQTLSNGEHLDHLTGSDPSGANTAANGLIYTNGNAAGSDSSYLSNVSFTQNHDSSTDCYNPHHHYNDHQNGCMDGGYLDEFNLNSTNAYNHVPSFDHYHQPLATSTPIPVNGNNNQTQKFTNGMVEDCFDKSSDSAVSSMSSDRIQSISDNDLIETSSESSSYGNNLDKSTHAQKKYRLFGKNNTNINGNDKIQDEKSSPPTTATTTPTHHLVNTTDYYPDYPHVNYVYSNSIPIETDENYSNNPLNYYAHHQHAQLQHHQQVAATVQHNHTYAQMDGPPPTLSMVNSIGSDVSQSEWLNLNPHQPHLNESSIKVEMMDDGTSTRTAAVSAQQQKPIKTEDDQHYRHQQQRQNHHDRDYNFNRDEKKARALNIPISTYDIINLPIDEFNEKLTKYELNESQLSLIRDIRRRGKNKVAAQNCRKRKMDQILGLQTEVDTMYSQKEQLENQYNQLLMLREMARDKYTKLYQFVVEASTSRQTFFELASSPPDFPIKDSSNEILMNHDDPSNHRFMVTTGSNLTSASSVSGYSSSSSNNGMALSNEFTTNGNSQKMNH